MKCSAFSRKAASEWARRSTAWRKRSLKRCLMTAKKKQLLEGFLIGRERVRDEMGQRRLF